MQFDKERRRATVEQILARLLQNFFQGIIVLAPIGITIWAVFFLFNTVDNILPNILHAMVPGIVPKDAEGNLEKIPGLGFCMVVTFVVLIGSFSSYFFFGKTVSFLNRVLQKTPGVKFIYSSVKDMMEAFAGNKKKFDKPVLANIDGGDVWRIGFLTQELLENFDMDGHVAVYIPNSYAISGNVFLVPTDKVKPLNKISAADSMKFAISGGVTHV
ncbi:DUF502 domain-containing protein [Parasediminibacterium sp. JCM 36343]|uniref:DUF502 domain-containing protein n=1 Tax=Parasediminibacterium sp. JCM 36343 TaxID=3374279 RepID=UPI0039781FF8